MFIKLREKYYDQYNNIIIPLHFFVDRSIKYFICELPELSTKDTKYQREYSEKEIFTEPVPINNDSLIVDSRVKYIEMPITIKHDNKYINYKRARDAGMDKNNNITRRIILKELKYDTVDIYNYDNPDKDQIYKAPLIFY